MKFFLFNISDVSSASTRNSDDGLGISTISIPANKLCNITASKGFINLTFDDAGIYEESFMSPGEAIEKVNISVASIEDREVELIEDILNFVSLDNDIFVMKFDAVNKVSNFRFSDVSTPTNLIAKVSSLPVNMETGRLSVGSQAEEFQDTIAGINFRGNLPSLDFNHEGLSGYSSSAEITSWDNAGTGGGDFSIASNNGTPVAADSSSTNRFSQKSANLTGNSAHFIVPTFTVTDDYTVYVVLSSAIPPMCVYGDAAGETVGFGGRYPSGTDLTLTNVIDRRYSFSVRHSGIEGAVATTQTDNTDNGTISYRWPESQLENYESTRYDIDVFIIRRDKDSNMLLHNRNGDIIGFIPSKTKKELPYLTANSAFRTDGKLVIERLGTVKDVGSLPGGIGFRGYIGRFGVIPQDIGVSKARLLAQDLFNFYKF